jgi:hypothetical protein
VEKILKLPTRKVEKKEKSDSKTSTIVDGWSKREKTDVCKILGIWGRCPDEKGNPDWEEVINKAHLRKSEEACSEYAERLLEVAEKYCNDETLVNDLKEFEIAPQTAKKLHEKVTVWDRLATSVFLN